MELLKRVGAVLAVAAASCVTATALAAVPDGSAMAPQGSESVPAFAQADRDRSDKALGSRAADGPARNDGRPPALQIPPGADSIEDGLWHLGSERWGAVRVYRYSTPIDVAPRLWRTARTLKDHKKPHFGTDRYGVIGLQEVSAYVDVSGRVVAVQATAYDSLTDIELEPNPAGTQEVGD